MLWAFESTSLELSLLHMENLAGLHQNLVDFGQLLAILVSSSQF